MLPAAQGAHPPKWRVEDRKVASIALAEDGTLHMGRLELTAHGDGLAVSADDPLSHVEAAALLFGMAHHDHDAIGLAALAIRSASGEP